ncbi:MAG: MFS transporter [Deltaproteobacteria bacterium]|nr:MFS transporter [Deltaproteobacteria bacterium]
MSERNRSIRQLFAMAALIAAGEGIFLLPFVVPRVFRPTLLDVFGLSNLQLGSAFSLYGLVAMGSYLAGGPLADRFSARRLMTIALLATAAGGLAMAQVPALGQLIAIYAFWGMTTILLFWAALIRATREWGSASTQGRAYGILDGGRGLLAAVIASLTLAIFGSLLPADLEQATLAERAAALKGAILVVTAITASIAALIWFALPQRSAAQRRASSAERLSLTGLKRALGMPTIWWLSLIVICAYCGYKTTDDFSLFARDAFGYDDVAAAGVGTLVFWMRPLGAVAGGLLADRLGGWKVVAASFVLSLLSSALIGSGVIGGPALWTALVVAVSLANYALRGVYFALCEQARVPLSITGSAVGLISLVGFTPDVFMGPLMGWLLDRSPGLRGHQQLFTTLAGFSALGLLAAVAFGRCAAPKRYGQAKSPTNSR